MKHTKGPWTIFVGDIDAYHLKEGEDIPMDEAEANARLIAAAPEMLQALIDALESLEYVAMVLKPPATSEFCENIEAVKSAIAKAKGGLK